MWGLLNGFYLIVGWLTQPLRARIYGSLGMREDNFASKCLNVTVHVHTYMRSLGDFSCPIPAGCMVYPDPLAFELGFKRSHNTEF